MADTPFNEANLISGIVQALQQCQVIDNAPPSPPPAPAANAATTPRTDDAMTNILTQMLNMQERYIETTNRMVEMNSNRNNGGGGGRGRGNRG